jgi:ribonuclease HI
MNKSYSEVKLVTDGACRGNPGLGATAFIIFDMDDQIIEQGGRCIGETTNNQAEYLALIEGLENASKYTKGSIRCFSDSQLVINQVKEEWKIKDEKLKVLFLKVLSKESEFEKVDYCHIKREHHDIQMADKLANQILDLK